jgi:hypothetical protein
MVEEAEYFRELDEHDAALHRSVVHPRQAQDERAHQALFGNFPKW